MSGSGPHADSSEAPTAAAPLERGQAAVLLCSIFLVALCGIAYELIIGTVSSYLVGDSVYQFSVTIGLFMFAMGVGSYLTKRVEHDLLGVFVRIEIVLAAVGGVSGVLLFMVFPFYALYQPTMYTLIIVVGALVGAEIPLLTRMLASRESLQDSIANVLSLDYVGALVGSVSFPLLLLPSLGLFRASFAIGLLNAAVALVNVLLFKNLERRGRLLAGSVGVTVFLVLLTVFSTAITRYAEGQLFYDRIVYRVHTPYQRVVLTQNELDGEIRLFLDGHIQFAAHDEYRYHEALVHPAMSAPGPRARVLVLGGGDGLAARELLKYPDVERIDLVDIDAAVTALSRENAILAGINEHSMDDPRVVVHNTDAFGYVRETDQRWDRVIIDLPDPHNEVLTKLYSKEFYVMLRSRLEPHAVIVAQSSSPFHTPQVFWGIGRTMEAAGFHPYAYQIMVPAFGQWGFQIAGVSGEPPHTFDFSGLDLHFLSNEVMQAAQVFAVDEQAPPDTRVNSIFEPTLYHDYQARRRNMPTATTAY
ncbi:MAG: polyamine aminopropyltransferase [Myxococcales bacterium]|nr:polyamine aminopropyltransferase [Myxococcales bacterium]